MKIIYEKGDVVEIQDDYEAPHELAAMTVELIEKISSTEWLVETVSTWVGSGGKRLTIDGKWFV
tara:strand:+ start:1684 stop:1875 length:192 start_codon:yes stop_codon:yes gene_type:complete